VIGETIGEYEVIDELGQGGMGTVYRARDLATGDYVALKILPPAMARQSSLVLRFKREIAALRQLDHEHIAGIRAVGEKDDTFWYAMQYIEGDNLEEVVAKGGKLPILKAIDIVIQIAGALDYAHNKGVVHRDIKPSNILLDKDGKAFLTDFGIAKMAEATRMTETGGVVGTAEYMSPEQAEGRRVDRRSDIYSLGIVLYKMLTGRAPFRGNTALEIMHQHRFAMAESVKEINKDVTLNLSSLVERMIEKDADKRIESAPMLIRILETIRDQITATPEERRVRRRQTAGPLSKEPAWQIFKWVATAAAVVLVAVFFLTRRPAAERRLDLARTWHAGGNTATARRLYEEVVDKWPETQWATEAELALREIAAADAERQKQRLRQDMAGWAEEALSAVADRWGATQIDAAAKEAQSGDADSARKRLAAVMLVFEGMPVAELARRALDSTPQSPEPTLPREGTAE